MPQGAVGGMGNPNASALGGTPETLARKAGLACPERHDAGPSSQIGGLEHAPKMDGSNGGPNRQEGASSGCGTGGWPMHGSGRTPGVKDAVHGTRGDRWGRSWR